MPDTEPVIRWWLGRPRYRDTVKRTLLLSLAIAAAMAVAGCGAQPTSEGSPSVSPVTVSVPVGGITLRELGFANGPSAAFSIPRDSVLTVRIDQPNVVTLYLSDPPPETALAYFRRALPSSGFTVSADGNSALRFSGLGWDGSIVGGTDTAVTLRRM